MRVFVSAGEPSGDHHAALLVRELRARRPDVECVGLGGPGMAAAGCTLVADMTRLAVMWFLRVLLNIHRFVDLARRAERSFLDARPDVCVLVDFPGFHWWLAWRAKRHGIPVVFYCPPQVWAWAQWRIGKMRRLVDHVLAALPFEHEWFTAQGMQSTLVGHPFFDECGGHPHPGPLPEGDGHASPGACGRVDDGGPLVLLLPGSRGQEIEGNLGSILRAAASIHERVSEARFAVAAVHERHAARIRETLGTLRNELGDMEVPVEVGRTRALIAAATAAVAVSGSVSLELLAARVPTVIVYRIGGFAYVVQSWFRHARFITLVNLLACREPVGPTQPVLWPPQGVPPADPETVFPEYLAVADPATRAADQVVEWLTRPAARQVVLERLDTVAAVVARPGSAARAAAAVLAIATGQNPRRVDTARSAGSEGQTIVPKAVCVTFPAAPAQSSTPRGL
jgi:lipid-A-disaccharide synthase